ncbi:hypothetical protein [Methanosarcina sp. MTP4]|uniref:hypothetical protein n=1 Tax=Methanosarcina sp. MTP4 TaxID=1434100 RepID=UPI0012E02CA0|nr:hypothetical protein [Methanosarcina sp. MTP4]
MTRRLRSCIKRIDVGKESINSVLNHIKFLNAWIENKNAISISLSYFYSLNSRAGRSPSSSVAGHGTCLLNGRFGTESKSRKPTLNPSSIHPKNRVSSLQSPLLLRRETQKPPLPDKNPLKKRKKK